MRIKPKKPILIAGPCAAESREQILESVKQAKIRNIDFLRMSLWKPRTKPGFDGIKEKGFPLLAKAAQNGVNPATEVLFPHDTEKVMETVLNASSKVKLLVWIGARNQNHTIQQEIARVASQDKRVYLMVKNQPWQSEEHWEGIIDHVLHGGISKDHLFICHRGFAPNGTNPHGLRNVPDFDMAIRMKEKTGLPMIFDPSHTGGNVDKVFLVAKHAVKYPFDGIIVEVHPNPKTAKTDAKQQLTWEQFDTLSKPQ